MNFGRLRRIQGLMRPGIIVVLAGWLVTTAPGFAEKTKERTVTAPYHVAVSERDQLQTLLVQHQVLLLDADTDYRSAAVPVLRVSTGVRLLGGWNTQIPPVLIEAGASNILLDEVRSDSSQGPDISFSAGAVTHDISITGGNGNLGARVHIEVPDGARIEHLEVNDYGGLHVSQAHSGFIRNSTFARLLGYWRGPQVAWEGNERETSYGNLFAGISSITPQNGSYWHRPGRLWLVSADCESWNMHDQSRSECFQIDSAEHVVAVSISGGTGYADRAGALLTLHKVGAFVSWLFHGAGGTRDAADMRLNGVQSAALLLTDQASRLGDESRPDTAVRLIFPPSKPIDNWTLTRMREKQLFETNPPPVNRIKPVFRAASDPPVAKAASLGSMADSSEQLQREIDRRGIVRLKAGTYYLDRPLRLGSATRTEGLLGDADNAVVLVPKGEFSAIEGRGDFVVDKDAEGQIIRLTLDRLTIFGGSVGIQWSSEKGNLGPGATVAFSNFSHLRFLHQSVAAVSVSDIRGIDANSWIHDDFIDVPIAFQGRGRGINGPMTYADKQAFMDCQFQRIGNAVWSWQSDRPSGGELWQDCYFQNVRALTATQSAIGLQWSNSVMEDVDGPVALHVLDRGQTQTDYFLQFDCLWRGRGPTIVADSLSFGLGALFIATTFEQTGGSLVGTEGKQSAYAINATRPGSMTAGKIEQGILINSNLTGDQDAVVLLKDGRRVERSGAT